MKTHSLFFTLLLAFTGAAVSNAPAQADPRTAVKADTELLTRTLRVPPDFLVRFGDPAQPVDPKAVPSVRKVLESYGIDFSVAGSAASFDQGSSRLVVRNTETQLNLVESLINTMTGTGNVAEGILQFEIFSLPPLAARKALIAHPGEADLYKWLDAEEEKKDSGVVLEHLHTLRVRGGQRSKVEGINDFPYSTGWDPPQIPQNVTLASPAGVPAQNAGNGRMFTPWPYSGITPGSFAVRNLGWTMEAELTFSEDHKTADLNLAPELVKVIAQIPQGLTGEFTQPVFQTQKSTSQVHAWVGKPALVGTLSPPTDTGAPGNNNKGNRVWLLFVTVTMPQ